MMTSPSRIALASLRATKAITTMLLCLSTLAPLNVSAAPAETSASRSPASAVEVDPVTKALYQALDERARSQSDFERNEAVGRPKENGAKKQLRIELGDELGGGVFPNSRRERFAVRRNGDQEAELPTIESKLDAESREARSQIRNERAERQENRHKTKPSRRNHWIDE